MNDDDKQQTPPPAQAQNHDPSLAQALAKDYLTITEANDDATTAIHQKTLTPDSIQYMLDQGRLYKTGEQELDPAVRAKFPEKNADGSDIPVYIVPNTGDDKHTAEMITLQNGQQIIVANEGAHVWTTQYAHDHLQIDDRKIADGLHSGSLLAAEDFAARGAITNPDGSHRGLTDAEKTRFQTLMDSIAREKGGLGAGDVHVVIDTDDSFTSNPAAALRSKGGTNYIFLRQSDLEDVLSSDKKTEEFKGVGGHELAHLGDGDMTAEGIVRNHDPQQARSSEILADLRGSGALGSHDAAATAAFFKDDMRESTPAYNATHAIQLPVRHASDEDLQKVSDWAKGADPWHPTDWDRVVALQDEARLMGQYEKDFKKKNHHAVTSIEEKQAESDAVIAQVMKDMQGKWQLPITEPAPGAAHPQPGAGIDKLPADHQAEVAAAREKLAGHGQRAAPHDHDAQASALATPARPGGPGLAVRQS